MIHADHHKPSSPLRGVDFTIMKQSLEQPPRDVLESPSLGCSMLHVLCSMFYVHVLCSIIIVRLGARKSADVRLFTVIFQVYIPPSSLWWAVYRLALGLCFLKENFSSKDVKDWYCFLLRLLYWKHPTLWNIHRHLKQITCCKHNCSGCELHLARAVQARIPPLRLPGHSSNARATIPYKRIMLIGCRILSAHTGTFLKIYLWGLQLNANTTVSVIGSAFPTGLTDRSWSWSSDILGFF